MDIMLVHGVVRDGLGVLHGAVLVFFFSSRRRHTICLSDWSSDVCSSDLCIGSPDARKSSNFFNAAKKRSTSFSQGSGLESCHSRFPFALESPPSIKSP